MRLAVMIDLIKEEWYDQRKMITGYYLGSVLLYVLFMIWSQHGLGIWLTNIHGGDPAKAMSVMTFIVVTVPYFIFWLYIVSRPNREYVAGLYPFLYTLPVTKKEIVTSRFASRFISQGVAIIWLSIWLWLVHHFFSIPIDLEVQAALFIFPCLLLAFLAVQLGLFFRWDLKGEGLSYILWGPLVLIVVFTEIGDRVITQLTQWYALFPMLMVGLCSLVVVLIWLVSWRWSLKYVRKYVHE